MAGRVRRVGGWCTEPRRMRHVHAVLACAWVLALVPSVSWWRDSLPFVVFISVYANIASEATGWQAARAEKRVGGPSWPVWAHGALTLAWVGLIIPSVTVWRESVPYLVFVSVYANIASEIAAWQATRVEEAECATPAAPPSPADVQAG